MAFNPLDPTPPSSPDAMRARFMRWMGSPERGPMDPELAQLLSGEPHLSAKLARYAG